jgi:CO/xanthine dehydrogenase Mo-binding subunit
MDGCVTMGLGYALSEEVHFKSGQILDTNFHRYQFPRFSTLPKIETVIVEANDMPPQGGGEPPADRKAQSLSSNSPGSTSAISVGGIPR